MTLSRETTLGDARLWLQERLPKGDDCPCCRRWAKVNRYTIGSTAARALVALVRLHERHRRWIHSKEIAAYIAGVPVEKILACTGDGLTKLVHWDLIEAKPNSEDPSKKETGLQRPTSKGVDFVHGRVRVPRWAEVFDDKLLRLDGSKTVGIRDVLGTKFDYAELMQSIAGSAPDLSGEGGDE